MLGILTNNFSKVSQGIVSLKGVKKRKKEEHKTFLAKEQNTAQTQKKKKDGIEVVEVSYSFVCNLRVKLLLVGSRTSTW
jgi:LDH2 family malate/lactate/ureidoglycolate dehydrogenase